MDEGPAERLQLLHSVDPALTAARGRDHAAAGGRGAALLAGLRGAAAGQPQPRVLHRPHRGSLPVHDGVQVPPGAGQPGPAGAAPGPAGRCVRGGAPGRRARRPGEHASCHPRGESQEAAAVFSSHGSSNTKGNNHWRLK